MDTTHDSVKQMVVAEVRRFVEREVIPVAHELEQSDTYPFDLIDNSENWASSPLPSPKPMAASAWILSPTSRSSKSFHVAG